MLTDIDGVLVGHWTDDDARTGCTVVLFPEGTIASGEVRGGSPATRDTELLAPGASMQRLDAVVLSGGSAFGLAAADGVMRWCEEHDRGVETPAGKVPIVVGLSIFDLVVGDPSVRPTAAAGHAAAASAARRRGRGRRGGGGDRCDGGEVAGPRVGPTVGHRQRHGPRRRARRCPR